MKPFMMEAPRGIKNYYNVDKDTGCWVWAKMVGHKGHGRMRYLGKLRTAHQVYWEIANNRAVKPNHLLHHKCHNPSCVNPEHLEEMTMKEHKRHHPDTRRKLDNLSAEWIRMWSSMGYKDTEIGRTFNISSGTIYDIKTGRSYQ